MQISSIPFFTVSAANSLKNTTPASSASAASTDLTASSQAGGAGDSVGHGPETAPEPASGALKHHSARPPTQDEISKRVSPDVEYGGGPKPVTSETHGRAGKSARR
jgi:hypothetical protein